MKNVIRQLGISGLLLFFSGTAAVNASIIGIAVDDPNTNDITQKGNLGGPSPDGQIAGQYGLTNAIEYFIPLNDSNYGGTYGVDGGFNCAGGGTSLAGTCSDSGNGSLASYDDATGLKMNLYFNTGGVEAVSASLSFDFDDLDLMPDNDPAGFKESISLSFWELAGGIFTLKPLDNVNNVITATSVSPDPVNPEPNRVTWDLTLAELSVLNDSSQQKGGFWIQLGFGAKYTSHGTNTPEYLKAALHLQPVPVPAAVWLFGTALIGLIGFSRRRSVQT